MVGACPPSARLLKVWANAYCCPQGAPHTTTRSCQDASPGPNFSRSVFAVTQFCAVCAVSRQVSESGRGPGRLSDIRRLNAQALAKMQLDHLVETSVLTSLYKRYDREVREDSMLPFSGPFQDGPLVHVRSRMSMTAYITKLS